jgi:hypothetical protein
VAKLAFLMSPRFSFPILFETEKSQTIRIVIMQGSSVLTQYMNDQLKEDMRRDELVADGKMSQMAADEEALLWSEVREQRCIVRVRICWR